MTAVDLLQASLPTRLPSPTTIKMKIGVHRPKPGTAKTSQSLGIPIPLANEAGEHWGRMWSRAETLITRLNGPPRGWGGALARASSWAGLSQRAPISAWYARGVRAGVQPPSQAIQVNSRKGFLLLLPPSAIARGCFCLPKWESIFYFSLLTLTIWPKAGTN